MLLDAAGQILADEGAAGLTVRRLANAVGGSTMAVYTAFGGKEGLVDALWLEGFERLGEALCSAPRHREPLHRLALLAATYRTAALDSPEWYGVAYGRALPTGAPPNAQKIRATTAYKTVLDAVEACVDAGELGSAESTLVCDVLWAAMHGHVSLEVDGYFDDETAAEQCFLELVRVTVEGFMD